MHFPHFELKFKHGSFENKKLIVIVEHLYQTCIAVDVLFISIREQCTLLQVIKICEDPQCNR